MKRELKIFFSIFLLLALVMHYKAWMSHPLEQLKSLFSLGWFGLHPLLITLLVYLLFVMLRGVARFLRK